MPLTRSLSALVGAVAIGLTLAGCSVLLPGSIKSPTPGATARPTVGECWNAKTADAADWADWKGGAAAACTSSHTLYTYEVGSITGVAGSSWADPGDPNALDAKIQAKAAAACSLSTLLPKLQWNQQLVGGYFFVPSEEQWKAGQRWVRCDVGVFATGTTLDNESFVALPSQISTLVNQVSSDPQKFQFCLDSSAPVTESGPLDNPDATLADCADSPQWRLATHGNLPDAAGAPFPDDATANAASSKLCQPSVKSDNEVWIAYLPTKAAWASGDREVDCWIGEKSLDAGGGTA